MTIRVRFAPSPTGLLHIGNARTALFNWLFARHNKLRGQQAEFILRLDDTDTERSEQKYAEAIERDLSWLGLTWDQFFRQSDRFDRYDAVVEQLKASGRLYACYETKEELDFKRKRQLAKGEPPIYDRASLKLTDDQKAAYESEGRQVYWRFRLLDEPVEWIDLIRGHTHFEAGHLSDPVMVRADGGYLYTITSVVDDVDYEITHIIRGEDHVTNTAVQVQLFQALGRDLSTLHFGHTSLILDKEGGALSKRLGSLSLTELRESELEPMAINSLLAHLGTSLPVTPVLTLDELASSFDLGILSRAAPRFDPADLQALNHKILLAMPYDRILPHLKAMHLTEIDEGLWQILRGNITSLHDLETYISVCRGTITPVIEDPDYCAIALTHLPKDPWDESTWSQWTNHLKEITGRKGRQLFMPLRQALTGMDHGPEMKDLLPIIGYERAQRRLKGE